MKETTGRFLQFMGIWVVGYVCAFMALTLAIAAATTTKGLLISAVVVGFAIAVYKTSEDDPEDNKKYPI